MAKKYFGTKNQYANMPQDVMRKSYPKKGSAISQGSYTDTQPELDKDYNACLSKLRKG